MPGLVSYSFLRCVAQPVRKFAYEKINLLLRATSCISVTPLQKHDKMIRSMDPVEVIWCEVLPSIVEFASKLLPPGLQNIVIHACYLSLIFFLVTSRSSAAVNSSGHQADVWLPHLCRKRPPTPNAPLTIFGITATACARSSNASGMRLSSARVRSCKTDAAFSSRSWVSLSTSSTLAFRFGLGRRPAGFRAALFLIRSLC
jgi:hypothetical protein